VATGARRVFGRAIALLVNVKAVVALLEALDVRGDLDTAFDLFELDRALHLLELRRADHRGGRVLGRRRGRRSGLLDVRRLGRLGVSRFGGGCRRRLGRLGLGGGWLLATARGSDDKGDEHETLHWPFLSHRDSQGKPESCEVTRAGRAITAVCSIAIGP
jgi:hypothetical protein